MEKPEISKPSDALGHKIDFFAYKRNIQNTVDTYLANNGFTDKEELKEFLYNEKQENPDGIIMEINTVNVGGPGMIEVINGADEEYIKTDAQSAYSQLIKKLHNLNVCESDKNFFEKYILAELKNKNTERIILIFNDEMDDKSKVEDIGLRKEYADYIPVSKLHDMLKNNKVQIEKTLLMGYGFSPAYRAHKHTEKFKEIFGSNYINQEEFVLSSKLWPSYLGWKDLSGSYFIKEEIDEKYSDVSAKKHLESCYVAKEAFYDQGKGIFFPGEWKFAEDATIRGKKFDRERTLRHYGLQKFHELPRKLSVENNGQIMAKNVDIRAYATFNPEEKTANIQLFGREGNIGTVNNVSSGGKFTKIYTVADDVYYDTVEELHKVIFNTGISQHNTTEKHFDAYAREHFVILPEARISHIPFIISQTGTRRIIQTVQTLISRMIDTGCIFENKKGHVLGTTILGVDLSINPLPALPRSESTTIGKA